MRVVLNKEDEVATRTEWTEKPTISIENSCLKRHETSILLVVGNGLILPRDRRTLYMYVKI